MKTNQIMLRDFDGVKIPQRTKDKFFNATVMLEYYNSLSRSNKRFKDFWDNQNTKEFAEALRTEILNGDNSAHLGIVESTRGRGGSTWMHPYLFVKFAFWLSPTFEVKVIKWIYDNLIEFRDEIGNYYPEMCKAISETYHNWYGKSPDPLIFIKEAHLLNFLVFGSQAGKQRNKATEQQLELMNRLQKLNITLIYDITPKELRYKKLSDFSMLYKQSV